ncbi:MAG TPA: hypothetical protein VFH48_09500 [Chloroflexota bacterium]|nr:hypothetical protein [Chloroflexota bacterium]
MPEVPPGQDTAESLHLVMLREIYDSGLEAASDVWPMPEMALGRLFERGASFLDGDGSLTKVAGRASPELLDAINLTREDLFLVEALYLLTRHVTYVLTEESNALEATWLGLADRHLQIRAEIVERRREEEQFKRQLRALGGDAVPLPEHDDLPMTDGYRPRKSRGMYQHLFDGASLCEVDLDLSTSVLATADRAAERRGWDQEWGSDARLLVLTYGISLALRERESDSIDVNADDSVSAAQAEARGRLMGLEGRYSTLRRRLFELRHNNRILRWRIAALEVEAVGMRSRLDQFLIDRDRLEQAIAERVAAGAVARVDNAAGERSSWHRRLGRLFGRST